MTLRTRVALLMVVGGLVTSLVGCVLVFGPVALIAGGGVIAGVGLFGVDVTRGGDR